MRIVVVMPQAHAAIGMAHFSTQRCWMQELVSPDAAWSQNDPKRKY